MYQYYPVFYSFKGIVHKDANTSTMDAVQESLLRYWEYTIIEDVTNSAKVWIPTNAVTFTMVWTFSLSLSLIV